MRQPAPMASVASPQPEDQDGIGLNIRWRLAVFLVQLVLLCGAAWLVTGTFLPFSIWFISGAVGLVLALQLVEPFFSRPADVVVSGVSVLLIVLVAERQPFEVAWWVVGCYAALGIVVAVIALTARSSGGQSSGRARDLSGRAYQLVRAFSGKVLYSAVFVVAVLGAFHGRLEAAVPLGLAWALVVIVSGVRWDRVLLGQASRSRQGEVVGLVAPSRLMVSQEVSTLDLGQAVSVRHSKQSAEGHVVRRLHRTKDVLVEVQLESPEETELFLGKDVSIIAVDDSTRLVGIVATDTTSDLLVFHPFERVEIGNAILARLPDGRELLHQVSEIRVVEESQSPNLAEQRWRATAVQLGSLEADGQIALSRGVLGPGAPLWRATAANGAAAVARAPGEIDLGTVIDTDVTVWMDTDRLVQGHMSILGMTRMGKSSFARRLATHLATRFPVIVVDQTGEYRAMGLPLASAATVSVPGLYLRDLESTATPHKEALKVLKELEAIGRAEYATGAIQRRVLILEEAHQFVPEPALLGFNAPGREESIEFGMRMMQVRKYGVSVILISQRTAVVAKSALSQCENLVVFKSVDQTGLEYLEAIGGAGTKALLPRLRQGEAVVIGTAISAQTSVALRMIHEPTPAPLPPPPGPPPSF